MKYDIVTFGSATLDIFIKSKEFSIKSIRKFVNKKGICFPFASKIDIQDLNFNTGGGGTNTAATFSAQGLKTGFCGKIGNDFAGSEVLKDLNKFKIDTNFVLQTGEAYTNLSIIFSQGGDKTCFVWRQASELLTKNEIPWNELKTNWIYIAPLSGKSSIVFKPLVDFAKKNNIKIFANPGNSQINLGIKRLKPILQKIDILLVNQQEASLLTNISYKKEKKIFKKLDNLIPGIVIMTKGKKGAIVSDGNYIWKAAPSLVAATEKTGAGDAFGSGFLASYIKNQDIEQAFQFAIANANACVQKIGAKQGILKKNQPWKKVKVVKTKF
ncbi:MAG: carbohydrate kinase family protein [Candidatus Pacebacteria bacterium]|nr:carbohydrate kinase family protein [Candidatus Paceibacterota bacterium]